MFVFLFLQFVASIFCLSFSIVLRFSSFFFMFLPFPCIGAANCNSLNAWGISLWPARLHRPRPKHPDMSLATGSGPSRHRIANRKSHDSQHGRPGIARNSAARIGISPAIYRAQNPETPKSLKKVSREEFGTPRPRTPEKFRKKSEKSKNELILTMFLTFRTFFGTFWGSGVGGSQTPLGRLF